MGTSTVHDMALQRALDSKQQDRVRRGLPVVLRRDTYMVRYELSGEFSSGEGGKYPWNTYKKTEIDL